MFSIVAGYALGDNASDQVIENIMSEFPDFIEMSSFERFTAILYNNVYVGFLSILSGFLMGIPSLLIIAFQTLPYFFY